MSVHTCYPLVRTRTHPSTGAHCVYINLHGKPKTPRERAHDKTRSDRTVNIKSTYGILGPRDKLNKCIAECHSLCLRTAQASEGVGERREAMQASGSADGGGCSAPTTVQPFAFAPGMGEFRFTAGAALEDGGTSNSASDSRPASKPLGPPGYRIPTRKFRGS